MDREAYEVSYSFTDHAVHTWTRCRRVDASRFRCWQRVRGDRITAEWRAVVTRWTDGVYVYAYALKSVPARNPHREPRRLVGVYG